MTEPQHRRGVEKRHRRRELLGLLLILVGGFGAAFALIAVLGWWSIGLFGSAGVMLFGWSLAASEDTGPGTPGTRDSGRDNVVEIDTENPDPGQFVPGQVPGDEPGTFYPPPPSRDSSRDFDRESSRDY